MVAISAQNKQLQENILSPNNMKKGKARSKLVFA